MSLNHKNDISSIHPYDATDWNFFLYRNTDEVCVRIVVHDAFQTTIPPSTPVSYCTCINDLEAIVC